MFAALWVVDVALLRCISSQLPKPPNPMKNPKPPNLTLNQVQLPGQGLLLLLLQPRPRPQRPLSRQRRWLRRRRLCVSWRQTAVQTLRPPLPEVHGKVLTVAPLTWRSRLASWRLLWGTGRPRRT